MEQKFLGSEFSLVFWSQQMVLFGGSEEKKGNEIKSLGQSVPLIGHEKFYCY